MAPPGMTTSDSSRCCRPPTNRLPLTETSRLAQDECIIITSTNCSTYEHPLTDRSVAVGLQISHCTVPALYGIIRMPSQPCTEYSPRVRGPCGGWEQPVSKLSFEKPILVKKEDSRVYPKLSCIAGLKNDFHANVGRSACAFRGRKFDRCRGRHQGHLPQLHLQDRLRVLQEVVRVGRGAPELRVCALLGYRPLQGSSHALAPTISRLCLCPLVAQEMKCEDGYMTVADAKDNSCKCTWPCDNQHCTGPYVAMPDYERHDPENLCTCQLPPRNKCHDEL
eukprot:1041735-Prorocentrum_minimum.AAC.2